MLVRIACILFAAFCGSISLASAQGHFTETDQVRRAYERVLEGRLSASAVILDSVAAYDPDNLLVHYVGDLADFLRAVITEEAGDIELYEERWERRMEALKDGNAASPYSLFTQAELHLHDALLEFRLGSNFEAATAINRACRLLKRNERKYPEFAPNLKDLGMLRAGVGTIPDEYRWAVKLVSSLEGTVPEGLSDLQSGIKIGRRDDVLQLPEMYFFRATAMLHFGNQPARAWDYLVQLPLDPHASPVICFLYANIAMKSGHNDAAIDILRQRNFHEDAVHLLYLDFMLGAALLYRTDGNAARPLLRFVRNFQGTNYIKEAYQKLAWHSLIHGDTAGYRIYMDHCLTHGEARTDEDKYAQEEALAGKAPHAGLLKARLLYDGGYYTRAQQTLAAVDRQTLGATEALEFTYRMGRILHAAGRGPEALEYYRQTIEQGRESPQYFACNAALQAGLLYEEHGLTDRAEEYFKTCLAMHPVDYKASLHQKAKAGLSRIRDRK